MSTDGSGHTGIFGDCPWQTHGPKESNEDDESVDSEDVGAEHPCTLALTAPSSVLSNLGPARGLDPDADLLPPA